MSDQYPGRGDDQDPAGRQNPYGQPTPYGQQSPYGAQENPYGGGTFEQGYGTPGTPTSDPYGTTDPDKRPATVTAASAITLVLSGLTGALFLAFGVIVFVARADIVDEINRGLASEPGFEEFGADGVTTAIGAFLLVIAAWCLVSCILAVLVLKRRNWARIALVVSAGLTTVVSVVGIGALLPAVSLIAAIAVIVMLFTGGANEWFRGRRPAEAAPGQTWG